MVKKNKSLTDKINIIAGISIITLWLFSIWIEILFFIGIGVACIFALLNFFIEDYKKTKRLEELENKLSNTKE